MTEFSPDIRWERIATNLRVEGALLPVLDLLQGLPVVVFKGALLTRRIYGDLASRASSDNDLWVPSAQIREALGRLLSAGFRPLPHVDPWRALRRNGQVPLWPQGDTRRVSVDLHEHPFSARYFSVAEATLQENLESVVVHDRELLTFNHSLAFVHMVAHYLQHHFEEGHLTHIGAAWDSWNSDLNETQLRLLARRTCSEAALELVLGCAYLDGHCRTPGLSSKKPLARLVGKALSTGHFEHSLGRKALSLALVAPRRLPQAALASVLLERDDLHSRYGDGASWRLYMRHLRYLLER